VYFDEHRGAEDVIQVGEIINDCEVNPDWAAQLFLQGKTVLNDGVPVSNRLFFRKFEMDVIFEKSRKKRACEPELPFAVRVRKEIFHRCRVFLGN
jgi:hypothetical protein